MDLDRLEKLIGKINLEKLKKLNVAIVGLGGVGSYVLESIVRCGISNITLIDNDIIDSTNLNRQIITTSNNIGNLKVDEAKKRATEINPSIVINCLSLFLGKVNIPNIINNNFDYVIDACDTVDTKIELIKYCYNNNIKIISSMGTAKKLDGTKFKISTLDKTSYCPLAKNLEKI